AFTGDLPVLISMDHQNAYAGGRGGDIGIHTGAGVRSSVELDSEEAQAVADVCAKARSVLSDSGSEQERVQSAERHHHASDFAADAVHVDVEGEAGAIVAAIDGGEYVAHVSRDAGDAFQA